MKTNSTILFSILLLLLALPALAQTESQYSDKEKKKMAEIAQRPEVQAKIAQTWADVQRREMQYAYNVNSASHRGEMEITDEFRQQYGQLYDNPILLRYVNNLGQSLVPDNSPHLYSFRLLLDPVPRAEALSTGTIYITTGMVSTLDNEAQLSYILAHEIAHIELDHEYATVRNAVLEEELDQEKKVEAEHKRALFSALSAVAGAGLGAGLGGAQGALIGGLSGLAGGAIVTHFVIRDRFQPTEWSKEHEDQADEAGLKYMLNRNYDAREIPLVYTRLKDIVSHDSRIGLGFMGSPERVTARMAKVTDLLNTTYKDEINAKLKANGLLGSSPEFSLLMASLKRDNGILALEYDLYPMAKQNLQEAVSLRSNDPRANYYLGKVMELTGRTKDDKQQAIADFTKSIQYDAERGAYPEPHLEMALYMISQNDPAVRDDIKKELKTYVALYQREHAGALPPNMQILYDYFELAGDNAWYVPPATVVSTKNVDAIYVTPVANAPSTTASDVVSRAVTNADPELTPVKLPLQQPVHHPSQH